MYNYALKSYSFYTPIPMYESVSILKENVVPLKEVLRLSALVSNLKENVVSLEEVLRLSGMAATY